MSDIPENPSDGTVSIEAINRNADQTGSSLAAPDGSAVTARELEVMSHALGLNWKNPGSRNHFCTGEGSDDYPTCEALVAKGLMERHTRNWTPDYIYTVTPAGRVFVLPNAEVSDQRGAGSLH